MNNEHLNHLDGWRGLAIVFLMVGHFFPVPGINFGTLGVNLFFVLSGLLMARLLFVQQVPLSLFYKRRISRVFPAVFFFLIAIVVLYISIERPIAWIEVAAAATFLNNYFPGPPGQAVMPFGHIWSLSVEEHSYILLSLIAIIARRRMADPKVFVGVVAILFALAGLYYWSQYSGQMLSETWLHTEVSAFGIFASAFLFLYFKDRNLPALPLALFVALATGGFAMHWWSIPSPLRTILGVGAFALLVNLLANAPKYIHSALSFKPLRQVGVWSFSIYLWQQPFYLYVHRDGMSKVVGMSLALLSGVASYYLLERPVRKFLNEKWSNGKKDSIATQAEPVL